jgi:hypothetical protein
MQEFHDDVEYEEMEGVKGGRVDTSTIYSK